MINHRVIARVYGILLIFEGLMMLATALVSYLLKDHTALSFLFSGIISVTAGVFVYTPVKDEEQVYGNREGYIILSGIWIIFSLAGTFPFMLSGVTKSFTDAFFESVSGFTTTGATIFHNPDSLPPGILLWRSLSQWLGGLGIIFLSLYILPVFRNNPIQLSTTEFSGQQSDKLYPRWIDAAWRLISIYVFLTFLEALLLAAGGLTIFDAVCISFSTLSTGGFSTHANSLSIIATPYIKIVITLFMFAGGTNMSVMYYFYKRDYGKIRENSEFIFYLSLTIIFAFIVSLLLFLRDHFPAGGSLINGSFHIVSIITTTGFYTNDYSLWGNFVTIIIFMLMFTGGTVGSASGGLKTARIMILALNSLQELKRMAHPDAYIPLRLNHKIVPQEYVYNILVFLMIYLVSVSISSFIISLMGYDLITSVGTAASMLANIGPGMGTFGPMANYSGLPASGKWFMSGLMVLGRLELLAVMVLFAKSFYRK